MTKYDDNNVFAKNVEGKEIHISEAISGTNGYFCLGCDREMQAVKSKIQFRASYFRHHWVAVLGQPKCTYSDETHRHKLAKLILARLKSVRVPALYKYPPKGSSGLALPLEEAKTVEAFSVGLEKVFYEDENGIIHCSPNKETEEKYLVIRPDVTFFDKNEKPILFVELVATHKLSDDKKIKLKRLGIDVIQIKIPKDSQEAIEKCLVTGDKTKWVYSHVEESTEYVSISNGDTKGIPPIDEEQRKLFEENFNCRRAQINNLIRTITRCLESKPYRESEQSIRGELSRVKGNTEGHRGRHDELRNEIQGGVDQQFESTRRRIEDEEREFENEEAEFYQYIGNLERRYISKRSDLEKQQNLLVTGDSGQIKAIERLRDDIDFRGERNRDTKQRIGREINAADAGSRSSQEELEALPKRFERLRVSTTTRFEQLKRTEREAIETIERDQSEQPGILKGEEQGIEDEFRVLRKRADEIIESRDCTSDSELSRRIKKLLDAGDLLGDYQKVHASVKRIRSAWECVNSGAYEDWV